MNYIHYGAGKSLSKKSTGNAYSYDYNEYKWKNKGSYEMVKCTGTIISILFPGYAILKDYETQITVIIFGGVVVYAVFYLLLTPKKVFKYRYSFIFYKY